MHVTTEEIKAEFRLGKDKQLPGEPEEASRLIKGSSQPPILELQGISSGGRERMGIETNAQNSGGVEAGGSAHHSSMAEAGTNGAPEHDQGPPERQRADRLAQGSPPEARSERIAAIQTAIANGTYQVPPEQTAEAILAEHVVRDESAA